MEHPTESRGELGARCWHTNRESLLFAVADHLGQLMQGNASFVIATVSGGDVVDVLADVEEDGLDDAERFGALERFVTEELWDTIDDGAQIVAAFDWMRDYATMSLTRLLDGRCLVWWNDAYVQHLPIGLMRNEEVFPDFFEAYNTRWHDLADEGGQWGGVPSVVSEAVPRAIVLRTIFRFQLYSGQYPSSGDASDYYDRLIAAGGAGIRDDELAMPPWVRPQERALWEVVYADDGGIT